MAKLQELSAHHCVLLAAHYATESDISMLRALTTSRASEFNHELILRILLTFLPEGAEPASYVSYLAELVNNTPPTGHEPSKILDLSSVASLSVTQARKKRRKLEIIPLVHSLYKSETDLDVFTHFLIHRAYQLDAATGLLDFVLHLLVPFLSHSDFLYDFFISKILPLIRLEYEYYPQSTEASLDSFSRLEGRQALDLLLSHLRQPQREITHAARDLRGLVSPWMIGANKSKRRKLAQKNPISVSTEPSAQDSDNWEYLYDWFLQTSKVDLSLVASAFSDWGGPGDVDLGGFEDSRYQFNEEAMKPPEQYTQSAIACLYAVDRNDADTLQTAHSLLTRTCNLLHTQPPTKLHVPSSALPTYDEKTSILQDILPASLKEDQILQRNNVLTQPSKDNVHLLEFIITSCQLLLDLRHPLAIREVARLLFRGDAEEQAVVLHKMIYALSTGASANADEWQVVRTKLVWLWSWAAPGTENKHKGNGLLGCVPYTTLQKELLNGLLESSHYYLAIQTYLQPPLGQMPLSKADVEHIILETVLNHYDNASNGNRTRGGMKRASDMVQVFQPHFSESKRFERLQALLAATHAMSFYSLTLQHGVPFQPVNVRVSTDALSLIRILLSQNSRSYTHLDDLVSIGQNLVLAEPSTLMNDGDDLNSLSLKTLNEAKASAERRVVAMSIEAALQEGDFETAYSYVVNRLTPSAATSDETPAVKTILDPFSWSSSDDVKAHEDAEDVAWQAALQAGRYSSTPSSSATWTQSNTSARPDLRRLEQRMELLSQALLLAPPRHLEEVLAVWQECETEMMDLSAKEYEAEQRFNDAADRRLPGAFANETIATQQRREVGRGAVEESPMGLFDVAKGAAAAFSKSAFPLRGGNRTVYVENKGDNEPGRTSMDLSDSGSIGGGDDRVRRRDMVANAVTGGLASGIGWMLGATPIDSRGHE